MAYDGKPFRGFASQRGTKTVGGTLAAALERVLRHPVDMTCAGRTDAGVHGWGQVVSFDAQVDDLDLPIEELDLSERPRNCLKRAQVNTIGELVLKTEDDLLAITNFGQKSLDEVIQKLDERGLSLRVKEG